MSIKSGLNKLKVKRKYHHMQETRKQNIIQIMDWNDCKVNNPDRKKILRKIQLVIGCTKDKANEYLDVVLGEEE